MSLTTRALTDEEVHEALRKAGLTDARLLGSRRDHAAGTVTIHTDKGSVTITPTPVAVTEELRQRVEKAL